MKLFILFSSLLIAGVLLTRCKSSKNDLFLLHPGSTLKDSLAALCKGPHAGAWEDKHIFMYEAKLFLKDDGTFTFHSQACMGAGSTEGHWTESTGKITLTSFETHSDSMYFDKVQLFINGDSLLGVNGSKYLGSCKFARPQGTGLNSVIVR